ncbi:hypothetical protein Tco_1575762 [Tanacetum coccineum]
MPVWCRMFQQTLDGSTRGWFECLPHDSINEWADLREAFATRFSIRRACFIMGVPEVMKISSFMDSVKSHELAKRGSVCRTKLPKGETGESHRKISLAFNGRDTRSFRNARPLESRRDEFRNSYRGRDTYSANRARDDRQPKEILATETQLRLPTPRPMLNPLKPINANRYCDYHQEKGHYTNDCFQLKKQLEMALESGKLNHLVKDVCQRGRGSHGQDDPQQAKIINVINVNSVKDKKRKAREATEPWMNIPNIFPSNILGRYFRGTFDRWGQKWRDT